MIVTSESIGTGGKLFTLGTLAHQSCGIAQNDDATDIAEEFSSARGRHPKYPVCWGQGSTTLEAPTADSDGVEAQRVGGNRAGPEQVAFHPILAR